MDQKPTLLEWIFKIGLPLALIALGIGMTGYSNFWLGVLIALFATVFFAIAWWLISRHHSLIQKICGFGVVAIFIAIIVAIVSRPAPLVAQMYDKPGL
jgi:hypothetical protein